MFALLRVSTLASSDYYNLNASKYIHFSIIDLKYRWFVSDIES